MLRETSISTKITIYVLLLSFIATLATSYIFFSKTRKDIEDIVIGELKASALQQSYLIDSFIKGYKERVNLLKSRTQMRISTLKYIEEVDKGSDAAKKHLSKINSILEDAKSSVEDIENIVIFDDNMNYIASIPQQISLGRDLDKIDDGISLSIKEIKDNKYIEMVTPLKIEESIIGYMLVTIHILEIERMVKIKTNSNIDSNIAIFYKDDHNTVKPLAYSNNYPKWIFIDPFNEDVIKGNLIKKHGVKDQSYYFIASVLGFSDWGMVVTIKVNDLLEIGKEQKRYLMFLLSISGILILLASIFLSRTIVKSISNMTDIASLISSGNYKERIKYMGENELGDLAVAINVMIDRLLEINKKLEQDNLSKERDLVQTRAELGQFEQMTSKFPAKNEITKLYNKGFFNILIKQEWNKCKRNKNSISLLLIKIDCFNNYKEALGYKAANKCLAEVSNILSASANRSGDIICEYNNADEFIIIIHGGDEEEASTLVERISTKLEEKRILHPTSHSGKLITFSIGYSSIVPKVDDKLEELIYIVEAALKKAIDSGGNKSIKAKL